MLAGVRLTRYGDAIADKTGLGGTWIGVVPIASVTSLPELATGVSSVAVAGTPDIAVDDLLFAPGPLLAQVSPSHSASALTAIMMTGVAVVGLIYRPHRIRHVVGWASLTLVALYALNVIVQFHFGG